MKSVPDVVNSTNGSCFCIELNSSKFSVFAFLCIGHLAGISGLAAFYASIAGGLSFCKDSPTSLTLSLIADYTSVATSVVTSVATVSSTFI